MVVRRAALVAAGGMCETNIAEDFLTSLFIHEQGWSSIYVPEVLAEGLAPEDFFRLHAWMKQRFEDQWDRQMREDAEAGRLDHLAEEALTEYHAGGTKPFPPHEKQGEQ